MPGALAVEERGRDAAGQRGAALKVPQRRPLGERIFGAGRRQRVRDPARAV